MEIFVMLSLMTAVASSASLEAELGVERESLCQSLAVAEARGAVNHCKETVWKNLNLEECRQLIGEEVLLQNGDPELALRMICCSLGICNGDAILELGENLPLEMKQNEWSLSKASHLGRCQECQKFFSLLQTFLKTSDTQTLLQDVLRVEICSLTTGIGKKLCLLAAEAYLPLMLKLSLQSYDFTTICQQLAMRELMEDDLDQPEIGIDWNMLNILLDQDQNNTVKCNVCQNLIEVFLDFIKKTKVTDRIAEELCKNIYPYGKLCTTIANLLIPSVIDPLIDALRGLNICELARYCLNDTSVPLHRSTVVDLKEAPTVCHLCQNAFALTIESLAVNKTEMTILNAMQLTCDSLWWPYVGYCRRIINTAGSVEMLSQRLHPRGACAMLGFCSGAVDVIRDIVANVASNRCSYCQSIAEYLEVLLGQESTVREMQSHVKMICEWRTFGMNKEECEWVVDKYAPVVVRDLIDNISENNFCQGTSLCTGLTSSDVVSMTTIPPAILELWPQLRCLYGSDFWCATMDNAKLCQVEEYCGS